MDFTSEQIMNIAKDASAEGLAVKVKDIAYYVLRNSFDNAQVAYRAAIDPDASEQDVAAYEQGRVFAFVKQWADKNVNVNYEELAAGLTFENNKAALIKMLDDIRRLEKEGGIEHKDAIKMATDIRVKLNDKFSVTGEEKSQIVVVPPKFNGICPKFRIECYEQTKEWAMANFHLIEDPAYLETAENRTE